MVTGSQQENSEYMTFSQSLMSLIVDELVISKPESTKFVFGDNTRFQATFRQLFSLHI